MSTNNYKGYDFYITAEIIGGCRANSIEEAKDICYREVIENITKYNAYIFDVNTIKIDVVEEGEERP